MAKGPQGVENVSKAPRASNVGMGKAVLRRSKSRERAWSWYSHSTGCYLLLGWPTHTGQTLTEQETEKIIQLMM